MAFNPLSYLGSLKVQEHNSNLVKALKWSKRFWVGILDGEKTDNISLKEEHSSAGINVFGKVHLNLLLYCFKCCYYKLLEKGKDPDSISVYFATIYYRFIGEAKVKMLGINI